MKKIFSNILKMSLCAVLLTFVVGCDLEQFEVKNLLPKGVGLVQLNINGSEDARTSFPAMTGVTYKITATPLPSGTAVVFDSLTRDMPAGNYNFFIEAQTGTTAKVTVASANLANVTIASRQTTILEVLLVPVTGGANGTLSWEISAPSVNLLDKAVLEYISAADFAGNKDWTGLSPFDEGTEALAPGSYLLRTYLEGHGSYSLGDIEAFHIYSGLATSVAFHYSGELLFPPKDAVVEVIITTTSTITGVLVELGGNVMDTHQYDMVKDTVNQNKWRLEAQVPDVNTEFFGTLFISTANNAIPVEFKFEGIACAPDATPVNLAPGGITINTITVSITGTGGTLLPADGASLTVGGVSLENGGKLDVLNGAQVVLNPIEPITNWKFSSLTVAGTSFNHNSGPATITTDTAIAVVFEYEAGYTSPVLFAWSQALDPWTALAQGDAVKGKSLNFPEIFMAAYGTTSGLPSGANAANGTTQGNGILLSNNRLSIGQKLGNTGNLGVWTASDTYLTDRGGQFDLSSRPFRVTIGYTNFTGTGWWRFNLRNNSSSNGVTGSIYQYFAEHSSTANFPNAPTTPSSGVTAGIRYQYQPGSNATSGTLILDVNPLEAYVNDANYHTLENAYFVIAAQSALTVTITGIRIEYTEPAPTAMTAANIYNNTLGTKITDTTVRYIEGQEHHLALAAKKIPAAAEGTFTWSANGVSGVTVGQDGIVHIAETAALGTSVIKAVSGSVEAAVTIEVYSNTPGAVDISGTGVTGDKGSRVLTLDLAGASDPVTRQLTAVISPAGVTGTILWETSNSTVLSVNSTGLLATVTVAPDTSTNVTITAKIEGYETITDTVTVTVKNTTPTGEVDPNLIFEWTVADGEPAGMVWNSGATGPASVSTAKLKGKGKFTEVPVSLASGANSTIVNWDNGIVFGNNTATTNRILVIGNGDGRNAATTASYAPEGVFDFSDLPAGKAGIKVTITTVNYVTATTGNLALVINNNTTTGGNTPLTPPQADGARILFVQNGAIPITEGDHGSMNISGTAPNAGGTLVSRTFKPGDFTAGQSTLAKAFIGLQHNAAAGVSFKIIGIRIEYVEGTTPVTLNVLAGGAAIPSTGITLTKPDSASLSAAAVPSDAIITWAAADSNIASLSAAAGNNVTITAVNSGKTTITVTAEKEGYSKATRVFDVTVNNPSIALAVKQGANPVGASVQITVGDSPITFTAEAVPNDAAISWTSGNTDAATVSASAGTSVNISAVAEGASTITVKAVKEGYADAVVTFSVQVTGTNPPDENSLIFNWTRTSTSVGGNPTDGIINATNLTLIGDSEGIVKTAKFRSATNTTTQVGLTDNGIYVNGVQGTNRFFIGTNVTTATTNSVATWQTTYNGDFDFSSATAAGRHIKISFDYNVLTAGTSVSDNDRTITLKINNNLSNRTSGLTESPLSPSVIKEIGLRPNVLTTGTGKFEAVFNPAAYSGADAQTSLANSFITILGAGGANGYEFVFSSIKIEYVPAPPPPEGEVLWQWSKTPAWAGITSGLGNTFFAAGYSGITVRTFGGMLVPNDGNGGIRLGGIKGGNNNSANGGSGGGRLVIGQALATATTAAADIVGDFDFSDESKDILVTIEYADVIQYGSQAVLRVLVNNNTGTTSASSLLGDASFIKTYTSTSSTTAGGLLYDSEPGSTLTSGTIKVRIDPTSFSANAGKASLGKAFLCLYCHHDADTANGTGNYITINGIKIEKVNKQ